MAGAIDEERAEQSPAPTHGCRCRVPSNRPGWVSLPGRRAAGASAPTVVGDAGYHSPGLGGYRYLGHGRFVNRPYGVIVEASVFSFRRAGPACPALPVSGVAEGHGFVRRGGALLRPWPGQLTRKGRTGSSAPTHDCRCRVPSTRPGWFSLPGHGPPGRRPLRWGRCRVPFNRPWRVSLPGSRAIRESPLRCNHGGIGFFVGALHEAPVCRLVGLRKNTIGCGRFPSCP